LDGSQHRVGVRNGTLTLDAQRTSAAIGPDIRGSAEDAMTWPAVTVPTVDTLSWAARSVGPQVRVRSARPFSDRSASWRLELAGAEVATVVLRAGDPADELAHQHIGAEVAALTAAAAGGVPAPRLIAHDTTGAEASQLAIVTTFVEGSSAVPPTVEDEHFARVGSRSRAPGAHPSW
jgi:aminoglycoside phosphotransferase (APT) family kinase protein